jgi:hypothetical protein
MLKKLTLLPGHCMLHMVFKKADYTLPSHSMLYCSQRHSKPQFSNIIKTIVLHVPVGNCNFPTAKTSKQLPIQFHFNSQHVTFHLTTIVINQNVKSDPQMHLNFNHVQPNNGTMNQPLSQTFTETRQLVLSLMHATSHCCHNSTTVITYSLLHLIIGQYTNKR